MSTKQIVPTVVTVQEAEATLAGFEKQRQALIEQHEQHTAKRRSVAYEAHAGDAQAGRLLDGLHEESVRFESRMASIADAIGEARRRLEQAHQHEAREQDRARALQLRQTLGKFIEAGGSLDAALGTLVSSSEDMRNALTEMNQLGCSHPTHEQLSSLGALALRTALTNTGWSRYFERVSPSERKTFAGLVAAWSATVERHIASRLGDEQTNKTEVA